MLLCAVDPVFAVCGYDRFRVELESGSDTAEEGPFGDPSRAVLAKYRVMAQRPNGTWEKLDPLGSCRNGQQSISFVARLRDGTHLPSEPKPVAPEWIYIDNEARNPGFGELRQGYDVIASDVVFEIEATILAWNGETKAEPAYFTLRDRPGVLDLTLSPLTPQDSDYAIRDDGQLVVRPDRDHIRFKAVGAQSSAPYGLMDVTASNYTTFSSSDTAVASPVSDLPGWFSVLDPPQDTNVTFTAIYDDYFTPGGAVRYTTTKQILIRHNPITGLKVRSQPEDIYAEGDIWYVRAGKSSVSFSAVSTRKNGDEAPVEAAVQFPDGAGPLAYLGGGQLAVSRPSTTVDVPTEFRFSDPPFLYAARATLRVRHRFPHQTNGLDITDAQGNPPALTLAEQTSVQLTARRRFDDDTTEPVAVTWSLKEASAAHSIDPATGLLKLGKVTALENLKVQATYIFPSGGAYPDYAGQTAQEIQLFAIENTDNPIVSIQPISGSASVAERSATPFVVIGTLEDGRTVDVTPRLDWTTNATSIASFPSRGQLASGGVVGNRVVTITAREPVRGLVQSKPVTILDDDVAMAISGPTSVNEGTTARYTAAISHTSGPATPASPVWSIVSGSQFAQVSASGVLTATAVTANSAVTLRAHYADEDGETFESNIIVTIVDVPDANKDSDEDGVPDSQDPFPNDRRYSKDADRDGLPDEWETQYGLDPTVGNAPGDFDGDGLTNIAEFEAGLNPAVNEGAVNLLINMMLDN